MRCSRYDTPRSVYRVWNSRAIDDVIRHAYAFLYALPEPSTQWSTDVNATLKTWPRLPGASPRGTVGQLRSRPEGHTTSSTAGIPCRVDNIHRVKGDEHRGVLLLIPDDDAGTRWTNGNPAADELLRNWYVAVTRAQHLIAIAIQPAHLSMLAGYLAAREIPLLIG